jgi:ubiquinone/menaquinone biosynthesis C-methylase UbiE
MPEKSKPTQSLDEIRKLYLYKKWLPIVNDYVAKLEGKQYSSFSKKQAIELEHTQLDEWWWGEHYKDFSRYSTFHYLYAGLNCFDNYSKPSAIDAFKNLKNEKIKSIIDVGAGIGLSTMLLSDLFPEATVLYNNIEGSLQEKFFNENKQKCFNVKNLEFISNDELLKVRDFDFDLLFASEYFEHFDKFLDWTSKIIEDNRFRYIVVNNSFSVEAYGHFKEYQLDGTLITPRQASRQWLTFIRNSYEDMKVKCWNGRPRMFVRK